LRRRLNGKDANGASASLCATELEQEFLPYLLTSEGRTVFEHIGGVNMALLPPPSEGRPGGADPVEGTGVL